VRLGEIADLDLGKMLDQKKNKGTPRHYLANIDVRWGSFNLGNLKEMLFKDSELERYGLRYGDIVMCEGGEPGRCAIWKEQRPGMMYQKALHRIRPHEGIDHRFLYYHFLLLGRKNGFAGLFTGSTIKHMPKDKLALVEIPLPPLPVQRRIADVLSAYDDLIENNRRRIAILEETARLTYRKWFGGSEQSKTATLGEVCQTFGGGTPKTSVPEFWNGDIPWVVPTDITRNTCLSVLDTERKITELGLEKSSTKMLPANAILMTSRASVGYFGIADFSVCTNQGFISIIPNDDSWRWYLLFNLMSRVEEIRSNAKGSTFPEISRARFRSMDVAIPEDNALIEFNNVVEPLMQQVRILAKQNAFLATARDMLLPRLMKGELV
jgi:type I restriction enzyme S subunit